MSIEAEKEGREIRPGKEPHTISAHCDHISEGCGREFVTGLSDNSPAVTSSVRPVFEKINCRSRSNPYYFSFLFDIIKWEIGDIHHP
jgi:hypothetical protein